MFKYKLLCAAIVPVGACIGGLMNGSPLWFYFIWILAIPVYYAVIHWSLIQYVKLHEKEWEQEAQNIIEKLKRDGKLR